jgi:hypothetical protein
MFCSQARHELCPDDGQAGVRRAKPACCRGCKSPNVLKLTENGLVVEGASAISAKDVLVAASKNADTRDAFVVKGSKLTRLSELSSDPQEALKQKIEFIQQYGEAEFAKLSRAAATQRPNVVVNTAMSRADWLSMSMKERSQAVSLWGVGADRIVGQIMSRRGKK